MYRNLKYKHIKHIMHKMENKIAFCIAEGIHTSVKYFLTDNKIIILL